MASNRLQHGVGAHDVGREEGFGIAQRVVVVGLRCEIDDGVCLAHEVVHQTCVGDAAGNHRAAITGQAGEGTRVGCVGHGVQDDDSDIRVLDHPVHEVAADESGPTGDHERLHNHKAMGCWTRASKVGWRGRESRRWRWSWGVGMVLCPVSVLPCVRCSRELCPGSVSERAGQSREKAHLTNGQVGWWRRIRDSNS